MDLIKVAQILNTHGIKGGLKIRPFTDFIDRFSEDVTYYIDNKNNPVHIENYRVYKGLVYINLEEYDNINDVLIFKGKNLYIAKEDRYELPEGLYYISDLIGFEIIDEKDGKIGTLKEVLTTSANDVYVVDLGNNKEALIPAVKEFIVNIDTEENRIFVKLIEGMLLWSLKYWHYFLTL